MLQLTLFRMITSILFFCLFLYLYIDMQNSVTKLRLKIPPISDEVRELEEVQKSLLYQKARYEDPKALMKLLRKPEFSYLKKPTLENVIYFNAADDKATK